MNQLLLFFFLISVALPVHARHWNEVLQDCSGGTKGRYRSLSVREGGFRLGQLFTPFQEIYESPFEGPVTSSTTVELTTVNRSGQKQVFTNCAMHVSEDFYSGEIFVSVRDCSRGTGGAASPSIMCSVQDEVALAPARVNTSRERKEAPEGRSGRGDRGAVEQ